MKHNASKQLSRVLEVAVWILMGLAVAMLVALPWVVNFMMDLNPQNDAWNADFWRVRYLVTLGVSGVAALLMLWQARTLLHNASIGKIFSLETVRCLKVFSVEALVTALFYVVMLFFGMTKFSIGIIALAFALGGLIAWVFAGFFRQATEYKQENDMTI